MKIASFSVENYRSIISAGELSLAQYSLLIGANNEGKSNILRALSIGMSAISLFQMHSEDHGLHRTRRATTTRTRTGRHVGSWRRASIEYDWSTDYPVSKQSKESKNDKTKILFTFTLDDRDLADFREQIDHHIDETLSLGIALGKYETIISSGPSRDRLGLFDEALDDVTRFISQRIHFEYIPAIRTAEVANRIMLELVGREIRNAMGIKKYEKIRKEIEEQQQPVLRKMECIIKEMIQHFAPAIKTVSLMQNRSIPLPTNIGNIEIYVDDGQPTPLDRKGEGLQSLVTLALMGYASTQRTKGLNTIFAIEEPESHLHPEAVHEIRTVLEALSNENQVMLASHSPLFVNPNRLDNTIIVRSGYANPAKNVAEIRETLGVRFSDNLEHAQLVLLVEGKSDVKALGAIIPTHSQMLARLIENRTVVLEGLGGVGNLVQRATNLRNSACMVMCFIDHDQSSKDVVSKIRKSDIIQPYDITYCCVDNHKESKLEDLYEPIVYREAFIETFGVDPALPVGNRGRQKWSNTMKLRFEHSGNIWDDDRETEVKTWLANYAASHPCQMARKHSVRVMSLANFISKVEKKCEGIR